MYNSNKHRSKARDKFRNQAKEKKTQKIYKVVEAEQNTLEWNRYLNNARGNKFSKLNEHGSTYQMFGALKAVLRGKVIPISSHTKK